MHQNISVVTICFNNLNELAETCISVDEQTVSPVEHWIIDGSNNNEIINWLNTHPQPIYRHWLHEQDKGIADAFNKGISKTTGIIHLLNSGDKYFSKDAISIVQNHFENNPDLMWLHSQYVQHRGGVDVITGTPFDKHLLWKGMRTVAHPTMFVKKKLYDKYGPYSLEYKIAMDYDFLVKIREEKFCFIAKPLVYFAPGGASNVNFTKGLKEVENIYTSAFGFSWKIKLWQTRQSLLHRLMQTRLGEFLFNLKNKSKIQSISFL